MTLSATDKSSGITLTNGNLTATTTGTTLQGIRASRHLATGAKVYWEAHPDVNASDNAVAIANAGGDLTTTLWKNGTPNAAEWWGADVYYNGVFQNVGPVSSAWQRYAYDDTAKKWWVGDSTGWLNGDPAAGTSGLSVSGIGTVFAAWQGDNGDKVTFNFGDSAFQYTLPSGFVAATSV
jgi:hypothetical protein